MPHERPARGAARPRREKAGARRSGAYDGISARLIQQAGFPAVYMTGYGTAASRLGLPDLGFAGLAEMADHARNLVSVVDVPLIADADTGYGNALNVPLLYNYAPGGRSPLLPFTRLRELGFAVILLPVDTLLVGTQAIRGFLARAKAGDDVRSLAELYMPFAEFNELIGVTAQLALAERYRDDERSAR